MMAREVAMAQATAAERRMRVVEGDITALDVDAIVNAANEALAPGGGVCGAIHRAAGPELARACAALDGCATGDARLTPGFRLKARHVIHAVGPVWRGGGAGEDRLLARAYARALELAAEHGLESVAFPAISTGIYGFPPDRAAPIAVRAVADFLADHPGMEVLFCCFGRDSAERHEQALAALGR
jgi:O-acetyl-ADP-ribose deacetylase (regulator of RNase III)